MIELKKPDEIEKLRIANQIVAKTLNFLENEIKIGMSLKQIDKMAEDIF